MADPVRSPIAALLANLKDTAALLKARSGAAASLDRKADLAAEATDMANLAHHLEAAIEAQVKAWRAEMDGNHYTTFEEEQLNDRRCADLKGEP